MVRSRLNWGVVLGFLTILGLDFFMTVRMAAGKSLDVSGWTAVTLPGFAAALLLTLGISAIKEFEAPSRPVPEVMAFTTILVVAVATALWYSTQGDLPSTFAYGPAEKIRNLLVYLTIGLLPAMSKRWEYGPYLVGVVTVLVSSAFALTRRPSPLLFPARPVEGAAEVYIVALLAVVVSIIVVWRASSR